jgi:cell division septation protein DedD
MAKAKKKRTKKLKKQSLARNVALLILSVVILAGVSFVFSRLNARPEYSTAPIEKNISKIVAKASQKNAPQAEKAAPQKSAANPYDYSYWDILLLQDESAASGDAYSIQIAAYKSRDEARSFADEVQDKDRLRCEVEEKGKVFVVRWGSFRTREMAERYCGTLTGRLGRECVVVKL